MKKNRKKMFTMLVATSLMGSLAVACSSNTPTTVNSSSPKATTGGAATPSGAAVTYPLKSDKTLTYWGELPGNLTGVKAAHTDVPFFQEWQKKTGVPLKFLAPPTNQGQQA
ncbi:ABC transporter substrate-binding protein, partial [Paenibacillus sp. TAF58]